MNAARTGSWLLTLGLDMASFAIDLTGGRFGTIRMYQRLSGMAIDFDEQHGMSGPAEPVTDVESAFMTLLGTYYDLGRMIDNANGGNGAIEAVQRAVFQAMLELGYDENDIFDVDNMRDVGADDMIADENGTTKARAQRLASEWHGGQSSPLYSFASSGSMRHADQALEEIDGCIKSVRNLHRDGAISDAELDRYTGQLMELAAYIEGWVGDSAPPSIAALWDETPGPGPECDACDGSGWIGYRDEDGRDLSRTCTRCDGQGAIETPAHWHIVRATIGSRMSVDGPYETFGDACFALVSEMHEEMAYLIDREIDEIVMHDAMGRIIDHASLSGSPDRPWAAGPREKWPVHMEVVYTKEHGTGYGVFVERCVEASCNEEGATFEA